NHHLLALMWLAPAFLMVCLRRPPLHTLQRTVCAGMLGFATWVYLPLRAARHPLIDWGAPTTLRRFYWTVSAQAFQKSLDRAEASDAGTVLGALSAQLHPVGLLLGLGGAYLLFRLPRLRAIGLCLLCAAALTTAAPGLVGFDVANPDAYGYLEGGVALLA